MRRPRPRAATAVASDSPSASSPACSRSRSSPCGSRPTIRSSRGLSWARWRRGPTSPVASAPWRPSGVVTLTTDFGLSDPYVGIMHGVLLARARGLAVVDLTHGIAPQDVRAAAFHLAQSWRWFPPGTVHVAVVDPGVGSARRILVARDGEHAFLAPDN